MKAEQGFTPRAAAGCRGSAPTLKEVIVNMNISQQKKKNVFLRKLTRSWQLYVMMLLPLIHLLIFRYQPMYGLQMAFRNFSPMLGFWDSPWVGLAHFTRFFESHMFERVLRNTLIISIYGLVAGFPLPILLALSLNYIKSRRYAKTIQTTTFLPFLISTVVFVGIIFQFLQLRNGVLNNFIEPLFGTRINFLGRADMFYHVFVWTGIWQATGFSAIIYIAGLAGIDPSLHEAAIIDGATKMQRILHIDIPGILPTITILFILNMGQIMNVGFERVLLMQNPLVMSTADVISTYVYRVGLAAPIPQWSFASAVGFFESVVGFIMLIIANFVVKKLNGSGIW